MAKGGGEREREMMEERENEDLRVLKEMSHSMLVEGDFGGMG